jgi:hypothetical protein
LMDHNSLLLRSMSCTEATLPDKVIVGPVKIHISNLSLILGFLTSSCSSPMDQQIPQESSQKRSSDELYPGHVVARPLQVRNLRTSSVLRLGRFLNSISVRCCSSKKYAWKRWSVHKGFQPLKARCSLPPSCSNA